MLGGNGFKLDVRCPDQLEWGTVTVFWFTDCNAHVGILFFVVR